MDLVSIENREVSSVEERLTVDFDLEEMLWLPKRFRDSVSRLIRPGRLLVLVGVVG